MNNLLIRQKCIEANPEIVEIKAGCEAISGRTQFRIIFIEDHRGIYQRTDGQLGDFSPSTIFDKIIGRRSPLADVLLAIEKKGESVCICANGEFTNYANDSNDWYGKWNLSKDSLEDQRMK